MATTETRTGFRLPWSQDHSETDKSTEDAGAPVDASGSAPIATESASTETERPDMIDATTGVIDDTPRTAQSPATDAAAPVDTGVTAGPAPAAPAAPAAGPTAARKPNKLMADLAKAMQAAAQGARTDTLEKFAADAKAHVETINADSATEATELRRQADVDIAGIRDWSKAEIARIREETEGRISGRKSDLDGELEDNTASTERRIARVQARVDAFEAEMAYFFEVLFAEEDPTKLAAMAQSLPEPPDFDDDSADVPAAVVAAPPAHVAVPSEPEMKHAAPPADDTEAALEAIAAAAHAADVAEAEAADRRRGTGRRAPPTPTPRPRMPGSRHSD